MHVQPHVERLARLLHNRIVRRVSYVHPEAAALLVVGDLVDGAVVLQPVAAWGGDGTVVADGAPTGLGEPSGWQALADDLRADFALLGRVSPVELFVPYVLDLRQLDLRLESDATPSGPALLRDADPGD